MPACACIPVRVGGLVLTAMIGRDSLDAAGQTRRSFLSVVSTNKWCRGIQVLYVCALTQPIDPAQLAGETLYFDLGETLRVRVGAVVSTVLVRATYLCTMCYVR